VHKPGTPAAPSHETEWQAPNRAHGLRTYFTPSGPRLVPRTATTQDWTCTLEFLGHGPADEAPQTISQIESTRVLGNRFEYLRSEGVIEWYVNTPEGLEQGFTLAPDFPNRGEVALHLGVQGNLTPRKTSDDAIDLYTLSGAHMLRYGALRAWDDADTPLPAHLDIADGTIRIVVDLSRAAFPVTIDPLITAATWAFTGQNSGDNLGISVAGAGDVNGDGFSDVLVGAYLYDHGEDNEGRAFLFLGGPGGPDTTPDWWAESDQINAHYGFAVASAGDVNGDGYSDVIIGAPEFDGGETNEGRAFLYLGSPSGLSATPAWTAEGNQANASFGLSVAAAGDINGDGYSDVIVGVPRFDHDADTFEEGVAQVFLGSSGGLQTTPACTLHSGPQNTARFGWSVAGAGDVNGDGYADVVVGAYLFDNGQANEGQAFVYHGSASGLITTPAWTAENNQANAWFGYAVAGAGDVNGDGYADVLIGANYYDSPQVDAGQACLYYGSSTGLSPSSSWTLNGTQANAWLGISVAGAGDVNGDGYADLVVGAPQYNSGQTAEGQATVYLGSSTGPQDVPAWTGESNQDSARFGYSVAGAGDVNGDGFADIIVGIPYYSLTAGSREGRAQIFLGAPSGLSAVSGWDSEGNQNAAWQGFSLAAAGDVNGDGFGDVALGAPGFDNGAGDEGRVVVFHGASTGPGPTPDWTLDGAQSGAQLGYAVAAAGDVNGDGYGDLVIGEPYRDGTAVDAGRAWVIHGSAAGLISASAWTMDGNQAAAHFGHAVSFAGDVNGDGFAEVVIGAPDYTATLAGEGRALVYAGSASGLSATPAWTADGGQAAAQFGYAVACAGDIHGDGFSDLLVGAPGFGSAGPNSGRILLYPGSLGGLSPSPAWVADGSHADAQFGFAVAAAGDVNGDAYGDVLAAEPYFTGSQSEEGRVRVYHGAPAGLPGAADWFVEGGLASAHLGYSVAGVGDVNGDGFSDVVLGAPGFSNGQPTEGRASLFHGGLAGLSAVPAWAAESNQDHAALGFAVAGAGDVNGDGYADVLAAAPYYDAGQSDEGRTFLYYGNGESDRGLGLNPRQRRMDNTAPIAPLGLSDDPGGVGLALLGRTAFGRGKVKVECEVKPLGTPFDGLGTTRGDVWADTGTSGVDLHQLVYGLPADRAQHWRVRLWYWPVNAPLQPVSRWLVMPWHGPNDVDFRTPASPAAAPTDPGATDIATDAITWTWTDHSDNESGFIVWSDAGSGAPSTLRTTTGPDITAWRQEGLAANTQYAFQAAAANSAGQSARTPVFSAWTRVLMPLAPLLDNPGTHSLEVAIDAADGNPGLTLYALQVTPPPGGNPWIQSNGVPGASPVYQTSAAWGVTTVTGLNPASAYGFRAVARNGAGVDSGPGPEATGITLDSVPPPASPGIPGATGISPDAITWTWTDLSDNEAGFMVWSDPGSGPPTTLRTTTAANVTSWRQAGLAVNTQYAFQTAAANAGGQSSRTPVFTAWTLALPPRAPLVSNPGGHSLDVAIDAADGNPFNTLYALHVSPAVTGHSWIQSNGIPGANPVYRTAIAWEGTVVTTLNDATLYSFHAVTRNGAGVDTNPGPEATGTTLDETPPTAVITRLNASPTSANSVAFSIQFDESVGNSLTPDDVTLAAGSLAGTITLEGPQPTHRYTITVLLQDPVADGHVGITISASGVTDLAGNLYAGGVSPLYVLHNWPGFSTQPSAAMLYTGGVHLLQVVVNDGGIPTTYQWKWVDSQNIIRNGPSSAVWTLASVIPSQEGRYWCEVAYDGEPYASDQAMIHVHDHLRITEQPQGAALPIGGSHTFRCTVEGGYLPMNYVWTRNDIEIFCCDATFTLNELDHEDTGAYQAIITDLFGDQATSNTVQLTIHEGMPATGILALTCLTFLLTLTGAHLTRRPRPQSRSR
jgi:hypothetical protein